MDWMLEVVAVPVSDVDRAKAFYVDRVGFACDLDDTVGERRFVQLTPPGSNENTLCAASLASIHSKPRGSLSWPTARGARGRRVEVADQRCTPRWSGVVEQPPVEARSSAPLGVLGELRAHEQQLLARGGPT
jgi:hypothetical protein